jgi:hypothetical protein
MLSTHAMCNENLGHDIDSTQSFHGTPNQGPVVGPYLHIVVVVTIYPLAHR